MAETYNAANARQVKKRAEAAKLALEKREAEFAELLALPAFRRFLWHHICVRCQIFQSPFNPNGSIQTLNVGRQQVGHELFAEIEKIDPKIIPAMMVEYSQSEARDE